MRAEDEQRVDENYMLLGMTEKRGGVIIKKIAIRGGTQYAGSK